MLMNFKTRREIRAERESEMQHTFALSSADMPRASGWYNCPDFTLTAQAVQQPGTDGHIHTPLVVNKLEIYNPEHKKGYCKHDSNPTT
jgi:hypothetical protein